MAQIQNDAGRFFRPSPLVDADELKGLAGLPYDALKRQLSGFYSAHNHGQPLPSFTSSIESDGLQKMLDAIVRKVWKEKAMPEEIDRALTSFYASELWKGVQQGYGMQLDEVDTNSPDHMMLQRLQQNVYHFSAAKNYAQLKSLSQAMLDDQGNVRSFASFRLAASQINNEFTNAWLQAEYNFALASAQMASKWQQIEKDKEILPLLQYETVGDDRVRWAHRELEGVVQPVDSPFWDTYYPPNGWNCRCDVKQLASGTITPMEKIVTPENMPDIFKFNPGKAGVAFPPGHPYYDGLPDSVAKQGMQLFIDKKKDEIQHQFKHATTIKEAEDFAKNVLGMKYVNFKGIDIGVVNDTLRGVYNTKKLMPELPTNGLGSAQQANKAMKQEIVDAYRQSDWYKQLKDSYGLKQAESSATRYANQKIGIVQKGVIAWSTNKGETNVMGIKIDLSKYRGVYINDKYGKSKEAVDALVKRNKESKWFTESAEDFSYIVDHELGHEIDKFLDIKNTRDFIDIFEREHRLGTNSLADKLSMYGATAGKNRSHLRDEMLAEAWAEFTTSKNPRPLAKEIGELMMKIYFQNYKPSIGKSYTEWLQDNLKLIRG